MGTIVGAVVVGTVFGLISAYVDKRYLTHLTSRQRYRLHMTIFLITVCSNSVNGYTIENPTIGTVIALIQVFQIITIVGSWLGNYLNIGEKKS